ncbi:MAG: cell division protein FtsL [Gammaproteobacteria bacterium]|nr:MAG: cell division protein FtsL [Gammaproteobacteria bacterium]
MKSVSVLGMLVFALVFGAVQVAESRYQTRQLMSQIQAVKAERDAMRLEWSQLVLEESTLTDEAFIYQLAEKKLNMALPTAQEVVYRTR